MNGAFVGYYEDLENVFWTKIYAAQQQVQQKQENSIKQTVKHQNKKKQ
jgi:hypothetical protein